MGEISGMSDEYPRLILTSDGGAVAMPDETSAVFFQPDEVKPHCTLVGRCSRTGTQVIVTTFWGKYVMTSVLPFIRIDDEKIARTYRRHVLTMFPRTGYER